VIVSAVNAMGPGPNITSTAVVPGAQVRAARGSVVCIAPHPAPD
jgi:hypothetical protein